MKKDNALLLAGIIFTFVTLIHLFRIYDRFELVVAGYAVPLWVNVAGLVITFVLAVIMFRARRNLI